MFAVSVVIGRLEEAKQDFCARQTLVFVVDARKVTSAGRLSPRLAGGVSAACLETRHRWGSVCGLWAVGDCKLCKLRVCVCCWLMCLCVLLLLLLLHWAESSLSHSCALVYMQRASVFRPRRACSSIVVSLQEHQ